MLACECPRTPFKITLPENETTANLKSASFVVIMLLHEGLTHIHSQKKKKKSLGFFWQDFHFKVSELIRHSSSQLVLVVS